MTTPAQLAANRHNATRSTGPRTAAGKATASINAVRHGVWAESPVVPGEDPAAWDEHLLGVRASLAPVGRLEQALADRAALLLWRLDRLARYETLATAADLADAALPTPAGLDRLGRIAAGRDTPAGEAAADAGRLLAAARAKLAGRRAAAAVFPVLTGWQDDRPVPAGAAEVVLTLAREAARWSLNAADGADPPDPGRPLLARLGRAERAMAAVPWTAGLVRRGLAVYAAAAGVAGGQLDGWVAARLGEEGRLIGEIKRLRR